MALTRWIVPLLLLSPGVAAAQSEAALKNYFEGRSVTLKLAMPGTESGVDIYPADPKPLDYPHYAERLKQNGTAIRSGQQAMVTKIRVKGTHVEFQLDGGGYGTMLAVPGTTFWSAAKPASSSRSKRTCGIERRSASTTLRPLDRVARSSSGNFVAGGAPGVGGWLRSAPVVAVL